MHWPSLAIDYSLTIITSLWLGINAAVSAISQQSGWCQLSFPSLSLHAAVNQASLRGWSNPHSFKQLQKQYIPSKSVSHPPFLHSPQFTKLMINLPESITLSLPTTHTQAVVSACVENDSYFLPPLTPLPSKHRCLFPRAILTPTPPLHPPTHPWAVPHPGI